MARRWGTESVYGIRNKSGKGISQVQLDFEWWVSEPRRDKDWVKCGYWDFEGLLKVFWTTRARAPAPHEPLLLLHQAGVAGYAEPFAVLQDPGIGEAAKVLVRLGGVDAFDVIVAGNDGGVGIHFDLDVVDVHQRGLELGIGEVGEELAAIADLTVVFGVDEAIADHAGNGFCVEADLGLIPHALERDDIGRVGRRVRGLGVGGWS